MSFDGFGPTLDLENGEVCPTCHKFAKQYKRKLNSGQAQILIWLFRQGNDWVHVNKKAPRHVLRNNEVSRLALWNLVEEADNSDQHRKSSGVWRITQAGKNFVLLNTRIPKYCTVYNNKILGVSDQKVDIKECLRDDFSYYDLMHE